MYANKIKRQIITYLQNNNIIIQYRPYGHMFNIQHHMRRQKISINEYKKPCG